MAGRAILSRPFLTEFMMNPDTDNLDMAGMMEVESPATVNEQCIPLDALAMPDESEQMASPEAGDTVRYHVEGKVVRLAGGMAYVMPESINGQPVPAASPADTMQNLQSAATETAMI